MSVAKLTRAQVEVLILLSEGPCETTSYTHHGMVGGACAAGFVRKGWAKETARTNEKEPYRVEITDEGRAALAAWRDSH